MDRAVAQDADRDDTRMVRDRGRADPVEWEDLVDQAADPVAHPDLQEFEFEWVAKAGTSVRVD